MSVADITVTQFNYSKLKHKIQDSIKQINSRFHEKSSSQIFMLYDMQLEEVVKLSRLK